jgi:hypothetical protein
VFFLSGGHTPNVAGQILGVFSHDAPDFFVELAFVFLIPKPELFNSVPFSPPIHSELVVDEGRPGRLFEECQFNSYSHEYYPAMSGIFWCPVVHHHYHRE